MCMLFIDSTYGWTLSGRLTSLKLATCVVDELAWPDSILFKLLLMFQIINNFLEIELVWMMAVEGYCIDDVV